MKGVPPVPVTKFSLIFPDGKFNGQNHTDILRIQVIRGGMTKAQSEELSDQYAHINKTNIKNSIERNLSSSINLIITWNSEEPCF